MWPIAWLSIHRFAMVALWIRIPGKSTGDLLEKLHQVIRHYAVFEKNYLPGLGADECAGETLPQQRRLDLAGRVTAEYADFQSLPLFSKHNHVPYFGSHAAGYVCAMRS